MGAPGYARVPYPWRATIDLSTRLPTTFFGSLVQQALRYGSPAKRRFGPLLSVAARLDFPPLWATGAAIRIRKEPRPDLNELKTELIEEWSRLALSSTRLPAEPPKLALLQLERASARTILV